MSQCNAYRQGDDICMNGFFQKAFCGGSAGCFSCGAISDDSMPHCLKDELPQHWLTDDGKPRFVPRCTRCGEAYRWRPVGSGPKMDWRCRCVSMALSPSNSETPR